MTNNLKIHILIVFISLLCWQCANRLGLDGGLRDEIPPSVNWDESDQNLLRNFNQGEFILSFDEFVKLDKPGEQIVISPPLNYNLTPISRGKKVIFRFHPEEELLENTTYTVQFGDAIQDITEGNPINNLKYVFSTGSVIDSMQVRVQLRDRLDDAVVQGALVMLYETLSDTVIRTGRPFYFSKSDSSGVALVENCKPGNYRIFALTDENRNYQLDLPEEKIGHIDTFISSTRDQSIVYEIEMYNEIEPPLHLNAVRADSQLVALTIGGDKEYLKWRSSPNDDMLSFWSKDTLFLYLVNPVEQIYLESDYAEPDTILVSELYKEKSKAGRFNKIENVKSEARLIGGEMNVNVQWNNPVTEVDASKIFLFDTNGDAISVPEMIVKQDGNSLDKITVTWKHKNLRDSMFLMPGAVTSWKSTSDSTLISMRPYETESLSNLLVEVMELDSNNQYILQLYTANDELLDEITFSGTLSFEWKVAGLFPAKHTLTLITDLNANGRLDGGWFDTRQFPEPSISREIDNLRPDWDVQTSIQPQ